MCQNKNCNNCLAISKVYFHYKSYLKQEVYEISWRTQEVLFNNIVSFVLYLIFKSRFFPKCFPNMTEMAKLMGKRTAG